jgi:hypothetical protein
MTQRVVSKRTKKLFVGFGAAGIATVCIVAAAEMNDRDSRIPRSNPIVRPAAPAQPAK